MITAFSCLKVKRWEVNEVAQHLAEIDGVSEVYSVAGRFDCIAIIRAPSNEQLSDIVTNHMLKIGGIVESQTMIAFQAFSRHNLERMFEVGMEEDVKSTES